MLQISECTRDIPCVDCDNKKCMFQGKKESDCPKYKCDRAYQQGLEDAWEAARKIILDKNDDTGLSLSEVAQIFYTASSYKILKENTASEAIAKIKEYEEQQKHDAIQIGDEVVYMDENKPRVVVRISGQSAVQITSDGKCAICEVEKLHKTGRTFPQIAEVLKEMRGESE